MRIELIVMSAGLLAAAAWPQASPAQERPARGWEVLVPEGRERSYEGSRYAPATRVGNLVFLSGVIGVSREGPNDPASQFERAFQRLETLLGELDLSLDNVLEMTTYHVNLGANRRNFLEVKNRFIEEPYPSWTAIGVERLWLDEALIEIRVTAVMPDADSM